MPLTPVFGRAGLDLHEDEDPPLEHDQVDLIRAGPPIHRQLGGARPAVVRGGPPLAAGAQGRPVCPPSPQPLPKSGQFHPQNSESDVEDASLSWRGS